ncbi:hypothetical protein HRbin01_01902 [archaeon HR01]|nr:hypothetical protein HRbin01_01902 [archaeon HR01]
MTPTNDGLDYIYYGAMALLASGLLTFIGFIASAAQAGVAGVVINVLGEFAFLAFGGLWAYGFMLHRMHARQYAVKR